LTFGASTINYQSTQAGVHQVQVRYQVEGTWYEIAFTPQPGSTPLASYLSSPATIHFLRPDPVPAPEITSPADGTVTNDNTPTVTGTGEPGATVVVEDNGTPIGDPAVVQPDGTWTVEITTPLSDGDHELTATQTDPLGNVSEESDPVHITVDTVPPAPPTAQQEDDVIDNYPTCDATPGDTITITWPAGTVPPTSTIVVGADGCWSLPIPPGVTGPTTVTETDPAGNESGPTVVNVVPPFDFLGDEIYLETPLNTPVEVPVLDYIDYTSGVVRAELSLVSTTSPSNGTVRHPTAGLLGGPIPAGITSVWYHPNADFYGDDYHSVTVKHLSGRSVTIPVHIKVLPGAPEIHTGGEVVTSMLPWAAALVAVGGALLFFIVGAKRRKDEAEQ
jgi:hypothetical protein